MQAKSSRSRKSASVPSGMVPASRSSSPFRYRRFFNRRSSGTVIPASYRALLTTEKQSYQSNPENPSVKRVYPSIEDGPLKVAGDREGKDAMEKSTISDTEWAEKLQTLLE